MKNKCFRMTAVLLIILGVQTIQAQTSPDISSFFDWNRNLPPGTLLHYEISTAKTDNDASQKTDFWIYYASDTKIETFHKEENLGTGNGILHDIWIVNPSSGQFERNIRQNLNPPENQTQMTIDSFYDASARKIRKQYINTIKGKETVQSEEIPMVWSPMVMHKDLGFWFFAFMPHIKKEAEEFTVCFNSYSHLILMDVSPGEKDDLEGTACTKYTMRGLGLLSGLLHRGTIWMTDEQMAVIQKMDILIALSWKLPRLHFQLIQKDLVSYEEWLQMMEL